MIDLHVHSTESDGTDTPCELVTLAKQVGLHAFALTDHDTIGVELDDFQCGAILNEMDGHFEKL